MRLVIKFILLLLSQNFLSSCVTYKSDLPVGACDQDIENQVAYSRAEKVQEALDQLVRSGVPGCALAVHTPEGLWISAAGLARIEDGTAMQTCHLQYLQSVSKTYMAVAILKLYEEGKLSLDAPISAYLPAKYQSYLPAVEAITLRMLLNHTSGLPDYNFSPVYVSTLLQNPDHPFTPEDYLRYVKGKPLDFPPGSRYSYRNLNYVLLALIADAISGDHARLISETIFKPLGLTHTFYRAEPAYLDYPELVNGYWDRHGNGIVENASRLQRNNVAALIGDDGIVTTPREAVLFLKGLEEGKLLSAATLAEMKTWVRDQKGAPRYGLGLAYAKIGDLEGFGHSGGGIGAGCELYYVPEKECYFFIAINLGTVTDSPLHVEAGKARAQLLKALLD